MNSQYYNEDEFFEAVDAHKEAEVEAEKIKAEVFSFERGVPPRRIITEKDFEILDAEHQAWDKVLEIARRPNPGN